jgi:hypothetical protein
VAVGNWIAAFFYPGFGNEGEGRNQDLKKKLKKKKIPRWGGIGCRSKFYLIESSCESCTPLKTVKVSASELAWDSESRARE